MKNLLFLSLLFLSTTALGQSKKAINRDLSIQLIRAEIIDDSLQRVFSANAKAQYNLRKTIFSLDKDLNKRRSEIDALRRVIAGIKEKMIESGDNPEQLVSENELNVIYSLVTEMIYQNAAQTVVDTFKVVKVEMIHDISDEKIKIQNVLLQAKINEYKDANSSNALMISQQKNISEKLNRLKTSATDQLEVCTKMKQKLEEKYSLLVDKQEELEQKRAEDRQKALEEQQKKEAKKKKSNSKIKFVPPVIVDEVPDEDNIVFMNTSSGEDSWNVSSIERSEESEIPQEPVIAELYAEEMPEFPGGGAALQKYIHDNLNYPQSAIDEGIQGKVYVKFVVTETGEISNIKVVRGVADCIACEMEAVRIISQMPKWIPGKNGGAPVACYYTLPIKFILE